MNQTQFDLICKIIQIGAPVLAEELCGALANLAREYTALAEENESLKAQLTPAEDTADAE
jgi:hypothetical protein